MKPTKRPDMLEQEGLRWAQGELRVAGVDEAGRGPLAGPVVAAAVVLPMDWRERGVPEQLNQLNDSKKLSEKTRERLFEALMEHPAIEFGISIQDAATIDRINILQATHLAMREALCQLQPSADHVLVDGLEVPRLGFPQTPLVKGDGRSYSIAAASILAKVTRDRMMLEYEEAFPGYGFAKHKGYGTLEHRQALEALGPSPIHRRSFTVKASTQMDLL